MVVAKKSQDASSPYLNMTKKMDAVFNQLVQNSSPSSLVADVVLQAVTSKNPNLRHLAGKDVEQ
ncbi:MAG TPA: hypothetical protein VF220_08050 [Nitrososphaeraceae archaeon]